ncbi:MAG: hypothetical protein Q4B86_07395 [Eubacteriales bacterium]|nr:hypothetical protein [Eubacteriales bacterium]
MEMSTLSDESESDIISQSESEEEKLGFFVNPEGNTVYYLEDGSTASDLWIVEDDKLYYINSDGYLQLGTFSEGAMDYDTDDSGEIISIKYNINYSPSEDTAIQGFDNLTTNKNLWVYTDSNSKLGCFYSLMYKSTTEAMSYVLGGNSNPQYSSPNSVQLKDDYVYYLPYTNSPSEEELLINKKLFRIKAGDNKSYVGAENVEGFKLVEDKIFIYSDDKISCIEDSDFEESDTINTSWMEAESFLVDYESEPGNIFLTTENGIRARGYDSSDYFKAGNFYYKLSPEGYITDVREKNSVNIGGYIYTVEKDKLFGKNVSRVVRTDSSGRKEIISSEFSGNVQNMHYDYESGCIFAEYSENDVVNRIIRIDLSGDVDYLEDQGINGGQLQLIALQDNKAIVKESVGELVNYYALRTRATVPLALSVEPLTIDESSVPSDSGATISGGESEIVIPDAPGEVLDNASPDNTDKSVVIGGSPGQ